MPKNNFRHGMNKTRFHKIWIDMKARCHCKSKTSYKNYGGRGIKVSEEWQVFENFRDDMLPSYLLHCEEHGITQTTLDRKNNDSDYCKKNCRWATYILQANNKTDSHILEFNGKKQSLTLWAREVGLDEKLVGNRIYKLKWSTEKALTTPRRKFTKNN